MKNNTNAEKILHEYETQGREILLKMYSILLRVKRKKDDVAYRRILEEIQKI